MASVQDRAKTAAWAALRGRNPLSPLSVEERKTISMIVEGIVNAEGCHLEREQQRHGAAGEQAEIHLATLQLSKEARDFLNDLLNGERGAAS